MLNSTSPFPIYKQYKRSIPEIILSQLKNKTHFVHLFLRVSRELVLRYSHSDLLDFIYRDSQIFQIPPKPQHMAKKNENCGVKHGKTLCLMGTKGGSNRDSRVWKIARYSQTMDMMGNFRSGGRYFSTFAVTWWRYSARICPKWEI